MKELWLILVSVAIGAVGQVALKYGALQLAEQPGTTLLDKLKWPIIVGLGLYGLSTILWILALKKVQLSYAYPMVSLGYIFVLAASYFLFHEPVGLLRISGVALILAGIVLVARS